MTLAIAYRRTAGSLAVNAPSLNTGCQNRLVVAIVTTTPVSSRAERKLLSTSSRSRGLAPGGTRSSSWKLTPYTPRSPSRRTNSAGGIGGRTTSPNGSRPGWPTVHSPKANRSSGRGCNEESTAPPPSCGYVAAGNLSHPSGRGQPYGRPTRDGSITIPQHGVYPAPGAGRAGTGTPVRARPGPYEGSVAPRPRAASPACLSARLVRGSVAC